MTAASTSKAGTPAAPDAASLTEAALSNLDAAAVTRLAQLVLHQPTAVASHWSHERIAYTHINPVSGGLFRLHGTARIPAPGDAAAGRLPHPWSAVLKVVRPPAGATRPDGSIVPPGYAEDPSHTDYWRREIEVYASGLLAHLPAGFAAPRCYRIEERSGSAAEPDARDAPRELATRTHDAPYVWLWLEDIRDEYRAAGARWPLSRYGLAAHHLGRFNAAGLERRPEATRPWAAHKWLRQWCETRIARADWSLAEQDTTWQHPLVRRAFPTPLKDRLAALRAGAAPLLAALDALPQMFTHQDAFSRNLLSRRTPTGEEETVAVDWAFAGPAAIGTEAGLLASVSVLFLDVPAEDYRQLDDFVFQGYLDGLADSGWRGDPRRVRLGYLGTVALRFGWIVTLILKSALDPKSHAAAEARWGRPFAESLAERARFIYHQLDAIDEAATLMRTL